MKTFINNITLLTEIFSFLPKNKYGTESSTPELILCTCIEGMKTLTVQYYDLKPRYRFYTPEKAFIAK